MLKLKVFTMPSTGRQLLVAALVTLGLLAGYHSAVYSEGEPDSEALDAMADAARAALLDEQPDLSARLKELPGYAVIAMSAAKLPGVGAGQGYGVVVDNRNQQRSYIKVTQIEVGSGIGAQKYKVIILFEDPSLIDRMIEGGVHYEGAAELGTGSNAGKAAVASTSESEEGYEVFKLTESGAVAAITVRALHAAPYLLD